jgi:hypothetical protein
MLVTRLFLTVCDAQNVILVTEANHKLEFGPQAENKNWIFISS